MALFLCAGMIYLLFKLVFPNGSSVKNTAWILLFVAIFAVVMYANGVTLINISETVARMGGVSLV